MARLRTAQYVKDDVLLESWVGCAARTSLMEVVTRSLTAFILLKQDVSGQNVHL